MQGVRVRRLRTPVLRVLRPPVPRPPWNCVLSAWTCCLHRLGCHPHFHHLQLSDMEMQLLMGIRRGIRRLTPLRPLRCQKHFHLRDWLSVELPLQCPHPHFVGTSLDLWTAWMFSSIGFVSRYGLECRVGHAVWGVPCGACRVGDAVCEHAVWGMPCGVCCMVLHASPFFIAGFLCFFADAIDFRYRFSRPSTCFATLLLKLLVGHCSTIGTLKCTRKLLTSHK